MKKIVFIRHGQSAYNLQNLFTGWQDPPLTLQGIKEVKNAGLLLKEKGFIFDKAYTSLLKRAIHTLNLILEEMALDWIPVEKTWRLNEKHYGTLQGFNKAEMAKRYGEEKVFLWRRGFDTRPQPLLPKDSRSPYKDRRYNTLPKAYLPMTESLKDCIERTLPYWQEKIFPSLKTCKQLLVAAHGNSLRGIIKYIKNIPDDKIAEFNLPTAVPYVFEFDDNLNYLKDYFLGNKEEIQLLMEQVSRQGKASPL